MLETNLLCIDRLLPMIAIVFSLGIAIYLRVYFKIEINKVGNKFETRINVLHQEFTHSPYMIMPENVTINYIQDAPKKDGEKSDK